MRIAIVGTTEAANILKISTIIIRCGDQFLVKFNHFKWLHSIVFASIICLLISDRLAWGQTPKQEEFKTNSCPADIKTLTASLLKDLPDYSNRVIQRTQKLHRDRGVYRYIITAGKVDFEPLNLPRIQYNPLDSQPPEQVFFTVLEREYNNNQKTEIQTYHWLFLTPTSDGWHLVTMFSRFGDPTENHPPAPPKETSNGIIGQGVRLWLRDCRRTIS